MKDSVAVFDIGSNAVRLVIYDVADRAPVKIHHERHLCRLGKNLSETGRLHPEGVERAIENLKRFVVLTETLNIQKIYAVATAAVRMAENGPSFVAKVKKECGIDIHVIDGDEEARLAAVGVMASGLDTAGVIGDYGGGSLELIMVRDGRILKRASVPLGSQILSDIKTRLARERYIQEQLKTIAFLKECKGKDFYALGGAWRSMARAHMVVSEHPLAMLDHYTVQGKKALDFAETLSRKTVKSLERMDGIDKPRAPDVRVASEVMVLLFKSLKPRRMVFSATGLREGLVFESLSPSVQKQDALLASCRKYAKRLSRDREASPLNVLAKWVEPLFEDADADIQRLVKASCLLSDISYLEHEDCRAFHAFRRILALPFYGASHKGRAFLALSQYVRHGGDIKKEGTRAIQKMLGKEMRDAAFRAGQAQRIGYLLTGGGLKMLQQSTFKITPKRLSLQLTPEIEYLYTDSIWEEMYVLAEMMGRKVVF